MLPHLSFSFLFFWSLWHVLQCQLKAVTSPMTPTLSLFQSAKRSRLAGDMEDFSLPPSSDSSSTGQPPSMTELYHSESEIFVPSSAEFRNYWCCLLGLSWYMLWTPSPVHTGRGRHLPRSRMQNPAVSNVASEGPAARFVTPTQELSHTMKTSLNLNDGLIRPSGSGALPHKPGLASFDLNLNDGWDWFPWCQILRNAL